MTNYITTAILDSMSSYSKVNTKGQITIPAKVRRTLGISPGERVLITEENGKAVVQPAGGYKSLRGLVPAREVPADFKKLRQDFLESLGTPR